MEVVARCPDCGNEQIDAFANCFVCMAQSRWWCRSCQNWLPGRACPACHGGVEVPLESVLGPATIGSTVAFRVTVRNRGKKMVTCTVTSPDAGVVITNPRLLVWSSGANDLRGAITLPPGPLGPRTFRLAFEGPVPTEARLVVEAVAPAPRIEFFPELIVLSSPRPGSTVRTSVTVRNTGNVPLSARLTCSESWLAVEPQRVELAPSELTVVQLGAKSKRTDSGAREARVRAEAECGSWEATVRYVLPEPHLEADPIAFGDLKPGRPVFADVILRNTGRVRLSCTIAAAHSWLQVRPLRLNLPPGREKKVRARAVITAAQDGPLGSELVATTPAGAVVLRVPVTATGKVPRPVLRPIRKQRVRDAIGAPVERKFQVANDGDGRLVCTATADQPWVRIITPELAVGPGKKRKLRYALDLPVLARGEHSATITLTSNGGKSEVPVTVHVLDPNPVLEVLSTPHVGPVSPDLPLSAFIQVRNRGVGLLSVRARSENPRVTIAPEEASVPMGPPVRFNLRIPVAGLPGGEHEVAVGFTSNGGSGRSVVRFRLPVEQVDVPALIDLGDRPAGRPTGATLRVKNTGPDRVVLDVRSEHQWVRPGCERVAVNPGETVPVPFRVDLVPGAYGPVVSTILLEGRAARYAVAVRAIARKVALVVVPGVVVLGNVRPGSERAFAVDVVNAGEIAVDVPELHVPGALEVWVRRATVRPLERVTLACRIRVNTRRTGQEVRTAVALTDDATVRCVAHVVSPVLSRVLAATAATGGLLGGGALSATVDWRLGVPLALLALASGAWLFWRARG
jgi:hypothetical protein